jgi:hypothetical protein
MNYDRERTSKEIDVAAEIDVHTTSEFAWSGRGKVRENSFRAVCLPSEIRTDQLPNHTKPRERICPSKELLTIPKAAVELKLRQISIHSIGTQS